jgi:hypothetical protein
MINYTIPNNICVLFPSLSKSDISAVQIALEITEILIRINHPNRGMASHCGLGALKQTLRITLRAVIEIRKSGLSVLNSYLKKTAAEIFGFSRRSPPPEPDRSQISKDLRSMQANSFVLSRS